ncbi:uncharacterized protein LOC143374326 isoform X2 [Andrena cerasifolii]|uniref:uncharacterized protein LOC143374326 isoform X2 n=1 Tax=Andrena cerasifolii TaxID=2819439 RepID=UPI004037752D
MGTAKVHRLDSPMVGEREMALETPSWLNLDFTERLLRISEDDRTIRVIDIFVKPATAKGDNYTSDLMRVAIEFTRNQGDNKVTEKKSLLFKFEPIVEGARRDIITKAEIFDTEITMLMDALRKMNDMLGYENRLGPRVLHVRMERPLCLIIEDLAPLGFRMADRQAGLDLAHSLLAMRGLGKFHASSVALCEKEPKQKSNYRKGICNEEHPKEITEFFTGGVLALAKEVEQWSELDKSYAEKLRAISSRLYSHVAKAVKRRDDQFNVINHGDCWVNNMLFRYEDGKPVQHIFVDFQMCVYTSPAIDLLYFLSTSPAAQVYESSMDELLNEYHRTLSSTMEQLSCKTAPPSVHEIKQYMKEREICAMGFSITALPIMLLDKNETKDLDELLSADGTRDIPSLSNPVYRKVMVKRLRKYAESGLLDL